MKRTFIAMILFVHVCCSGCKYVFAIAIAASRPERKVVETYTIDKYKLTLVRKIDWAGPWYYGYELRKKCCGIYLPKKYYSYHRDSLSKCLVRFEDRSLVLDKCSHKIIHP